MRSHLGQACILIAVVACSGSHHSKVQYGVTTAAQLQAEKGSPLSVQRPNPDTAVLVYPGQEKFQVQQDLVVAGFRLPQAQERSLLYWRHRFQDCAISYTRANADGEMQLRCDAQGLTVLYNAQADAVVRVVEHAAK